jgi:F0F1-type ATP synthase assembly protein I
MPLVPFVAGVLMGAQIIYLLKKNKKTKKN